MDGTRARITSASISMISRSASKRRAYWVEEITKLSGKFGDDSNRLEGELSREVAKDGASSVLDHLVLCGTIPEKYGHDSSEEKLYSKYTDILLKLSFERIGLRARVVKERADSADVEVILNRNIAFVADAKAFRLSRTAKNQKDFKVQQMHSWKRGKAHAIVVCPIFQLPSSSSQIYQQASTSDVCLMSWSHLSLSDQGGGGKIRQGFSGSLVEDASIGQCVEPLKGCHGLLAKPQPDNAQ